jgi:hypothetical protein
LVSAASVRAVGVWSPESRRGASRPAKSPVFRVRDSPSPDLQFRASSRSFARTSERPDRLRGRAWYLSQLGLSEMVDYESRAVLGSRWRSSYSACGHRPLTQRCCSPALARRHHRDRPARRSPARRADRPWSGHAGHRGARGGARPSGGGRGRAWQRLASRLRRLVCARHADRRRAGDQRPAPRTRSLAGQLAPRARWPPLKWPARRAAPDKAPWLSCRVCWPACGFWRSSPFSTLAMQIGGDNAEIAGRHPPRHRREHRPRARRGDHL